MKKRAKQNKTQRMQHRYRIDYNKLPTLKPEDAADMHYYQNSVIIKVNPNDNLIDDIVTCFNIADTFDYLCLAPLEFISRTEGSPNEEEYKEQLWQQVKIFYRSAKKMLGK